MVVTPGYELEAAARIRELERRSSGRLNDDIEDPVPNRNYQFGEQARRKPPRHKSAGAGGRPNNKKFNRVQLLGLGYNQDKPEAFMFVPQYNALSSQSSFGKLEENILHI